jgi:PAS domain S-box-containing protein
MPTLPEAHLCNAIDTPVWYSHGRGRRDFFNHAWVALTGRPLARELGEGWLAGVHPEDRERCRAACLAASNDHSRLEIEYRLLHRDGGYHWVRDTGNPLFHSDGGFAGHAGTCHDITARKRVERIWKNVVEGTSGWTGTDLFEAIVRHLALALSARYAFIAELARPDDEKITTLALWANGEYAGPIEYALRGTPCDRVVAKRMAVFPDDVQGRFPTDPMLTELGVESYAAIPLFDTNGVPLGILAVMHDAPLQDSELLRSLLTVFAARAAAEIERRRAEEQTRHHLARLAHVSRLNTAGELVTGIAHEVNQPLTAITNYARGAARRLLRGKTDRGELCDVLEEIALQAERAGDIIRHLRAFTGKRELTLESLDVADVVHVAARMTASEVRRQGAEMELDLAADLPPIRGDAIQLEQVVANLILNAAEALAETGARRGLIRLRTRREGAGQVAVEVADNGPGIGPERLALVFEPFYSSKPAGMGLGLAIGRSILEAHGGRLEADAAPGEGATFRLRLPAHPADAVRDGEAGERDTSSQPLETRRKT